VRKDYDIVGSYNNQRVSTIDAERTVNLFEYVDPRGKKPKSLLPSPGILDTLAEFPAATMGHRASFVFKGVSYVVIGQNIYSYDQNGLVTKINSASQLLANDSGHVGIDANTFQIIFVDGGNKSFIFDTSRSIFEQITSTSFPTHPIDVCYLDGFFVVADGGTNNFYLSEFNQGLIWGSADVAGATPGTVVHPSWTVNAVTDVMTIAGGTANFPTGTTVNLSLDGGAFPTVVGDALAVATDYYIARIDGTTAYLCRSYANATALPPVVIDFTSAVTPTVRIDNLGELQLGSMTAHPGTIMACRTLHRRLFLFSQFFTEVWENQGVGSNLPVRRSNSLLMEVGTPATGSVATGFDKMYFLSQDKDGLGSVIEVSGTQAQPISERALDFQFAQYAADPDIGVSDAVGFMVKIDGVIFYRLNFTAANHTWVYNVSMSAPGDRKWSEEEVLNGDRHPAQTHIYLNGINYYGDYQNSNLYYVSAAYNTNNGEAIQRMRIGKAFVPENYERVRIDRFQLDLLQGDSDLQGVVTLPIELLAEDGQTILTEDGDELLIAEDFQRENNFSPIVYLSVSRDGGRTYGYELPAPMGKLGEREFRTVWRKLGVIPRGQAFVPRIKFFQDSPFVILGASWSFEVLPE